MRLAMWVTLAVVFSPRGYAADDKKQQEQTESAELLARAGALQDIRADGSQPFHLHLQVHAEHVTTKPVDGSYDEVWLAPDKWRREMIFPGFMQVEVGDKDSKWLSRNASFRPSVAYAISRALDGLSRKDLLPEETVLTLRTKKKDGVEVHCTDLQISSRRHSLCFAPSGTLFSEETPTERFEYYDYSKFGDKLFPRHMQVYQSGERVLDIRAEELPLASNLAPELFQHDAGARQMAPCERPEQAPAKKIQPTYPPEARRAFQQGTVILYALLAADGHVDNVRVVQNVSPSLDGATVDAVRQWVYAPVRCGKVPLPTEIEVSVNFALSGH
jgi:TonB family protein